MRALFAFFCALMLFSPTGRAAPRTRIKLFTWWDYISDESIASLKAKGYDIDIVTYRTNEMAIARLAHNSEKFDVAILSNFSIDVLNRSKKIAKIPFNTFRQSRDYATWYLPDDMPCVPYFWSVSVFTYDSRALQNSPRSLQDLAELRRKGYSVGIIDDAFEVAARLILDSNQSADWSSFQRLDIQPLLFEPRDFVSDTEDLLSRDKVVTYGWHGSSAMLLDKRPYLKMSTGGPKIVSGFDAVCILNANRFTELKSFVLEFTTKSVIEPTMAKTQYFSPYDDHVKGLFPRIRALYEQVKNAMNDKRTFFIGSPPPKIHSLINNWWRSVRYDGGKTQK